MFSKSTDHGNDVMVLQFFSLSQEQDFPRNFNGDRHQNSYCQCYGKKKKTNRQQFPMAGFKITDRPNIF